MNIIKIVLVDDHSIFMKGLGMLLNGITDFKVVGEAENGQVFLDHLKTWQPDLVLMDIKMPVLNGIEASRKALEMMPSLKIIALTMFGEAHYCSAMAETGAQGFVQKNVSGAELEKAIRTVISGNNYFSRPLLKDLSPTISPNDKLFIAEYNESLTDREFEVLTHIAKGLSSHEIAQKMFISARTVEGHRANLISKTGTKNVVDLVIYAIRNGLIAV
jgi:DNA-binding NarL/FixJ family response regulator